MGVGVQHDVEGPRETSGSGCQQVESKRLSALIGYELHEAEVQKGESQTKRARITKTAMTTTTTTTVAPKAAATRTSAEV